MHLLLSLKHTHKDDDCFTFWRSSSAGYTTFKHSCGFYDSKAAKTWIDKSTAKLINPELIAHLWKKIDYEGQSFFALPNTEEVRNIIGVRKSQLIKTHLSNINF